MEFAFPSTRTERIALLTQTLGGGFVLAAMFWGIARQGAAVKVTLGEVVGASASLRLAIAVCILVYLVGTLITWGWVVVSGSRRLEVGPERLRLVQRGVPGAGWFARDEALSTADVSVVSLESGRDGMAAARVVRIAGGRMEWKLPIGKAVLEGESGAAASSRLVAALRERCPGATFSGFLE